MEIPDHPYRILIVGDPGSWKTDALLNVINHEADIHESYFYAKDSYETKCKLLINKRESTGLKYLKNLKGSIEY